MDMLRSVLKGLVRVGGMSGMGTKFVVQDEEPGLRDYEAELSGRRGIVFMRSGCIIFHPLPHPIL